MIRILSLLLEIMKDDCFDCFRIYQCFVLERVQVSLLFSQSGRRRLSTGAELQRRTKALEGRRSVTRQTDTDRERERR